MTRIWLEARTIACLTAVAWLPISGCALVHPASTHYHGACCPGLCNCRSTEIPDGLRDDPSASLAAPASPDAAVSPDAACFTEFPGLLDSPRISRPRLGLPVPACVARWHTRKHAPPAAPYPRFHPLPVRPMLAAAPSLPSEAHGEDPVEGAVPVPVSAPDQSFRYGAIEPGAGR